MRQLSAASLTGACVQYMSGSVLVEEERVCRLCHNRLGTRVFAAYPNGTLVCYRCLQGCSVYVCSVTGQDFRQEPGLPFKGPEA